MHLEMFQSGKGDCLLLSNTARTARILVDGGMPDAYSQHVSSAMGKLRTANKKLDLVYVSHIDQDHIGGILRMLDDEADWRVHEYQVRNGNAGHQAPTVARPPQVSTIWHNAFHEQLKQNAGEIEDLLAASAPILTGADFRKLREVGLRQADLVASIREAIRVSRRIGPNQLGIPLNPQSGGKLMMLRAGQQPIALSGMTLTILGPTMADLRRLRTEWNAWLKDNTAALKAIREAARRDEKQLQVSELDRLRETLQIQAESFGDPSKVTPPNLASLTLLVEQGGQSILLTGDARGDQIVAGLKSVGRLADGATFQVDVLKVPHHGSENNVDSDFCDTVIATDYVFCGNGEHDNPDLRVIELMARRRLVAPGKFKFWFNSSEAVVEKAAAATHMEEVEKLVRRLAKNSQGRLTSKFMTTGSSTVVA